MRLCGDSNVGRAPDNGHLSAGRVYGVSAQSDGFPPAPTSSDALSARGLKTPARKVFGCGFLASIEVVSDKHGPENDGSPPLTGRRGQKARSIGSSAVVSVSGISAAVTCHSVSPIGHGLARNLRRWHMVAPLGEYPA